MRNPLLFIFLEVFNLLQDFVAGFTSTIQKERFKGVKARIFTKFTPLTLIFILKKGIFKA